MIKKFMVFFVLCGLTSFFFTGCITPANQGKDDTASTTTTIKTTVNCTLSGDDTSLFKLYINSSNYNENTGKKTPASWDVDIANPTEEFTICSYIDSNSNNKYDNNELTVVSIFTITKGTTNNVNVQIGKTVITVSADNTNIASYTHPMLIHNSMVSGSSSKAAASYANGTITTYADLTGKYGSNGYLEAFNDDNNNGFYDTGEPIISPLPKISWSYAMAKSISISLK